jgi:hypothetical protein
VLTGACLRAWRSSRHVSSNCRRPWDGASSRKGPERARLSPAAPAIVKLLMMVRELGSSQPKLAPSWLAALLTLGCQVQDAAPAVAPPPVSISAPVRQPTPLASSLPTPAPSTEAPPPPLAGTEPAATDAEAAATDQPPPEPPGSTRGTIACGSARCLAGKQLCQLTEPPICSDVVPHPEGSRFECDDASDCKAGLTCCQSGASAEVLQLCTPRRGPSSDCATELCKPGGAPCPNGEHCEHDYCAFDRRVTCPTGGTACPKNAYCEWKSGQAACLAEPTNLNIVDEGHGIFGCTRPADCGPANQCCTSMVAGWHNTYCATNCDLTNTQLVCRKPSDCLRKLQLVPANVRGRAKLSCEPNGEGAPPWLKTCRLEGDF